MVIIGITGPTGSGKTTALAVLREMGAHIIDCDRVYHELLGKSREMIGELDRSFRGVIADGKLDRKRLAAIVFNDAAALRDLNAITHKYIEWEVDRQISRHREGGGEIIGVDAIALIESGFAEKCDTVVGVVAPPDIRAKRLTLRDGISLEEAMTRIKAQKPEAFYRDNCDFILENNDAALQFRITCRALFEDIISRLRLDETLI